MSDEQTLPALDESTLPGDGEPGPGEGEGEAEADVEDRIGRFVVLDRLGAGAMGVVYAAWDPQLERRVALKLLLPGTGFEASDAPRRRRMLREAQALAKLAHPNIVSVFDAGVVGGRVFVAMEFVEGETLRTRLAGISRTEQVLDLFSQAGRGLAAAHAAGLVHRDFKPDNVLVGRDGRVRVVDFGLARGFDEPADGAADGATDGATDGARIRGTDLDSTDGPQDTRSPARGSLLTTDMTRTGALMGTPAYLSPEGFRQSDVGPAGDQFSFCVAMWEAFHERRPFVADNLAMLYAALASGRIEPSPAKLPLPAHVKRALERGLSFDPAARWPSMDALLDAIAHDPRGRRRWIAAGAGALGLAGALVLASSVQTRREHARVQAVCEQAAARVDELWNDAAKAELRVNLEASGANNAEALLDASVAALDAFAPRWRAARREACLVAEAERSGSTPSSPSTSSPSSTSIASLREACLDDALDRLPLLLDGTAGLGQVSAQRVVEAAVELAGRAACDDDIALRQRADSRTGVDADELAALQRSIDEVQLRIDLGDHAQANQLAVQLLASLDGRGGHDLLEAEVQRVLGHSYEQLEQGAEAAAAFERAYQLALALGDDELAASVAERLIWVEGSLRRDFPRARLWVELAKATRRRAGHDDDSADVLAGEAMLLARSGDLEAARPLFEAAVADIEARYGEQHIELGDALNNLAIAVELLGDEPGARALYQRSLAIQARLYGDTHPHLADVLNNLGQLEEFGKHLDEAQALYERALDVQERSGGTEPIVLAVTLDNLAFLQRERCELERALEFSARALELRRTLPQGHEDLWSSLQNHSQLLLAMGRGAEALPLAEQGITFADAHEGDPLRRARAAVNLAEALELGGELGRAHEYYEQTLELLGSEPSDGSLAAFAQAGLGRIALARGDRQQGQDMIERALASFPEPERYPGHHARIMLDLADALPADDARRANLLDAALAQLEPVAGCHPLEHARAVAARSPAGP